MRPALEQRQSHEAIAWTKFTTNNTSGQHHSSTIHIFFIVTANPCVTCGFHSITFNQLFMVLQQLPSAKNLQNIRLKVTFEKGKKTDTEILQGFLRLYFWAKGILGLWIEHKIGMEYVRMITHLEKDPRFEQRRSSNQASTPAERSEKSFWGWIVS